MYDRALDLVCSETSLERSQTQGGEHSDWNRHQTPELLFFVLFSLFFLPRCLFLAWFQRKWEKGIWDGILAGHMVQPPSSHCRDLAFDRTRGPVRCLATVSLAHGRGTNTWRPVGRGLQLDGASCQSTAHTHTHALSLASSQRRCLSPRFPPNRVSHSHVTHDLKAEIFCTTKS